MILKILGSRIFSLFKMEIDSERIFELLLASIKEISWLIAIFLLIYLFFKPEYIVSGDKNFSIFN